MRRTCQVTVDELKHNFEKQGRRNRSIETIVLWTSRRHSIFHILRVSDAVDGGSALEDLKSSHHNFEHPKINLGFASCHSEGLGLGHLGLMFPFLFMAFYRVQQLHDLYNGFREQKLWQGPWAVFVSHLLTPASHENPAQIWPASAWRSVWTTSRAWWAILLIIIRRTPPDQSRDTNQGSCFLKVAPISEYDEVWSCHTFF